MDALNPILVLKALVVLTVAGVALNQAVMQGKPVYAAVTVACAALGWWLGASL